jgi:RHS repeat-associated protein
MYTGFNGVTNDAGQATFVLPIGLYRFRTDLNGTQFWSGEANHCDIPGCLAASVTVTIPLTISVQDQAGTPYADLPVYAFTGDTYTGFNGTSDAAGEVIFTLPVGDYRFRADLDGVQFWSGETTTCTIPGCIEDLVPIPGGTVVTDVTIGYTYDPIYRLTAADYSTGEFFHYTYDAVGNRLTQETESGTSGYTYDIANRLTSVDGAQFTWDANGNLLSDGASTYTYDVANRLRTVVQDGTTYSFSYNGLGDRVGQSVSDGAAYDYALDLAAGLTQVLDDGANSYLYGTGRIGEEQPGGWQYHLGDALGSVRELASSTGSVSQARSFEPFGSVLSSVGSASTAFSFTGEQLDGTGLTYLRARYYAGNGRFVTSDPWLGSAFTPQTLGRFTYVMNNPLTRIDPSGMISVDEADDAKKVIQDLATTYGVRIAEDWGLIRFADSRIPGGVGCVWRQGAWRDLRELQLTQTAIEDTADLMRGPEKFRSAMEHRGVTIVRLAGPVVDVPFGRDPPSIAWPLVGWLTGDILLSDGVFPEDELYSRYTVTHELAHVWDHRQTHRLSFGMMEALDTWVCDDRGSCGWNPYVPHVRVGEGPLEVVYAEPPPGSVIGCSGPPRPGCPEPYAYSTSYWGFGPGWEDWAESFASNVYPSYWRTRAGGPYIGLLPGGIRRDYIEEVINGIP